MQAPLRTIEHVGSSQSNSTSGKLSRSLSLAHSEPFPAYPSPLHCHKNINNVRIYVYRLTLQPVSLHIQGLTEDPTQISTVDDCCRSSEFGIHLQTSIYI